MIYFILKHFMPNEQLKKFRCKTFSGMKFDNLNGQRGPSPIPLGLALSELLRQMLKTTFRALILNGKAPSFKEGAFQFLV